MCIALSYKYKIFEKNKVILDVCLKVRCLYECVLKKLCRARGLLLCSTQYVIFCVCLYLLFFVVVIVDDLSKTILIDVVIF